MKKRLLTVLTLSLLLAVGITGAALAADYPVAGGNLYFSAAKGKIISCDRSVTEADIPAEIDGVAVTGIDSYAFKNCVDLAAVTIPNSVAAIGDSAFIGCTSLTDISIPNSVAAIGHWAFKDCSGLTNINVAEDNANYCSENGILFNKDKTQLIAYPAAKQTAAYAIPAGVEKIDADAFAGCAGLNEVSIPASLTYIGKRGFSGCSGLAAIKTAEDNAVYCSEKGILFSKDKTQLIAYPVGRNVSSYIIPDGVEEIMYEAFMNCRNLQSLIIPKEVAQIRLDAFYGCYGLNDVYYAGTEEEWRSIAIGNNNEALKGAAVHYNYASVAVTDIILNKTALALKKGATATLTATVAPDNATDKTVTWTSSRSEIATVDATGRVTAVASGEAIITAAAGEKSAECKVTVKKASSGGGSSSAAKPDDTKKSDDKNIAVKPVKPAEPTAPTTPNTPTGTAVKSITLNINAKTTVVDGKAVVMDAAPYLITINGNGYTMVPLRFISEQLGAQVGYNQQTKAITIN